jgi:DNA-binding transcriptional ArsR family regulator
MVQYEKSHLESAFLALADSTRRGVLEHLGRQEASITELAERFHMTLTGMKKHVGVLEDAGLVTTQKVGRVRMCRIGASRLDDVGGWIERYQQLWDARFSALDDIEQELQRKERTNGRNDNQPAGRAAEPGDRAANVGP